MTKLRAAMEAALMEDPDDLAAHMAYGDHLAEQGDPRGEFIQVQLALEGEKVRPARRKELQAREAALLKSHESQWLGPLAGLLGTERTWERGWLTAAQPLRLDVVSAPALCLCPAARFLARLEINHNPIIRPGVPDHAVLEADGADPDAALSALTLLSRAAFLPSLRVLRIGYPVVIALPDAISAAGLSQFVARTAIQPAELFGLPGKESLLEELSVCAEDVNLDGLFGLPLPRLRTLAIRHGYGNARLGLLAANASLSMLETLRLNTAWTDDPQELAAFFASPNLGRLRELELTGSSMGDEGCRQLVRSGLLKRLKTLELRDCGIGDAGAQALAWCADTERLDRLDLRNNPIGRAGVRTLLEYHIRVEYDGMDDDYDDDME